MFSHLLLLLLRMLLLLRRRNRVSSGGSGKVGLQLCLQLPPGCGRQARVVPLQLLVGGNLAKGAAGAGTRAVQLHSSLALLLLLPLRLLVVVLFLPVWRCFARSGPCRSGCRQLLLQLPGQLLARGSRHAGVVL